MECPSNYVSANEGAAGYITLLLYIRVLLVRKITLDSSLWDHMLSLKIVTQTIKESIQVSTLFCISTLKKLLNHFKFSMASVIEDSTIWIL